MAWRIDLGQRNGALHLELQGVLDAEALAALARRVEGARVPVRLVLLQGTEVDPTCLAALRALPFAALVAESPYLSRLLEEDRS
jgi:hypothetical protein